MPEPAPAARNWRVTSGCRCPFLGKTKDTDPQNAEYGVISYVGRDFI